MGKFSHTASCQVCGVELAGTAKPYCIKRRLCMKHYEAESVVLPAGHQASGGQLHRFCHQCGCLQPLSCFDGNKRSCREALRRRRVRAPGLVQRSPRSASPAGSGSAIDAAGLLSFWDAMLEQETAAQLLMAGAAPPPARASASGSGCSAAMAAHHDRGITHLDLDKFLESALLEELAAVATPPGNAAACTSAGSLQAGSSAGQLLLPAAAGVNRSWGSGAALPSPPGPPSLSMSGPWHVAGMAVPCITSPSIAVTVTPVAPWPADELPPNPYGARILHLQQQVSCMTAQLQRLREVAATLGGAAASMA